jgi:hypothetical protein
MQTFFEISIQSFNLFSFMMGVSFVALSSMWNGRLKATRLAFVYLAGLALWYGAIKPNEGNFKKEYNSAATQNSSLNKSIDQSYTINPRTHTPQPRNLP